MWIDSPSSAMRPARPFLKWPGGKRQLLEQFEPLFPREIGRYAEPFVGSGAVFFRLRSHGRLRDAVLLSDHNPELINAYRVVRDNVEALIDRLSAHSRAHGRDYYYDVRSLDRNGADLDAVERAARTIYLNKTCYNGLYRVNSKGHFNAPLGSYRRPSILQEAVLRAASAALQDIELETRDYADRVAVAQPGDFVYFDPPYQPLSRTSSFTSYTAASFNENDQRRLAQVFHSLTEAGCRCMLSNSATPLILDLYSGFRIERVRAKRVINSKAGGRGAIDEVVVLNYDPGS